MPTIANVNLPQGDEVVAAIKAYDDGEQILQDNYKKFWIDKFAQVNIHFQGIMPTGWVRKQYRATAGPYTIELWTYPRRYVGGKFIVTRTNSPTRFLHNVTIRSDSGFLKFLRNLECERFLPLQPCGV